MNSETIWKELHGRGLKGVINLDKLINSRVLDFVDIRIAEQVYEEVKVDLNPIRDILKSKLYSNKLD